MSLTVRIKEIDTNEYADVEIPTEWKDMTLEWYVDLLQIIKKHTKAAETKEKYLEEAYIDSEFYEKIIEDTEFFNETLLNQDIFSFITGMKKENVKKTKIEEVNKVLEVLNYLTKDYEPKGIDRFELDGDTYYFPQEYLKNNTFGDFIETSQLDKSIEQFKNGRFDVLPQQMAILCRKAGEQYDEDAVDEKTEKFKKLTMDKVFEFAFFLTNQNPKYLTLLNMYLGKKEIV